MLTDAEIDRIADEIIAALGLDVSQREEMQDAHGADKMLGCSIPTVEFGSFRLTMNVKGCAE